MYEIVHVNFKCTSQATIDVVYSTNLYKETCYVNSIYCTFSYMPHIKIMGGFWHAFSHPLDDLNMPVSYKCLDVDVVVVEKIHTPNETFFFHV